jgi:hypothetical protein
MKTVGTPEAAVAVIARRYQELMHVFKKAYALRKRGSRGHETAASRH